MAEVNLQVISLMKASKYSIYGALAYPRILFYCLHPGTFFCLDIKYCFQICFMSSLIEDNSFISAFNLLWYVVVVSIHKENLASHNYENMESGEVF